MSDTKFVNETILMICKKLNELSINYYIAGAIGGYIDAGISLERKHDDLDILIEEKDVEKLKIVFENTDFDFYDNRFISEKVLNEYGYTDGDHEVCAWHKFSDFHIGFFLVSFDEDSYTISEYFKDNNKQKKLDRTLPIEYFKYQYNEVPINYLGVNVKVARKELIYKNKKAMGREKDLFDIERLERCLDYQILDGLKGLSKKRESKIIEL